MKAKVRDTWRRLSADGKRVRLWVLLGMAGILLIGLSECAPSSPIEDETPAVALTAVQVERALEQRVGSLLTAVEGVGECRVLVTLESTARQVYASRLSGSGSGTADEEVLVVSTEAGPAGLLLTTLQPAVKGIAVACKGGSDPAVQQRVIQVVATAFHISERRVCVVALQ